MKILFAIVFIFASVKLDAKKLNSKRSTLVLHHDYLINYGKETSTSKNPHRLPENLKMRAAEELLYMFGLKIPRNLAHYQATKPPKYMVDLYKAVANLDGSTKMPDQMNAETVRSVLNKDPNCPNRCQFNLNFLNDGKMIANAELHVFLNHPRRSITSSSTYVIKIFQILPLNDIKLHKILVAARHLPFRSHGWQIFPFLTTVTSWINTKDQNLVLSIELSKRNGDVIQQRLITNGKQPIIITFSNDSKLPTKYVLSSDIASMKRENSRTKRTRSVKGTPRHKREADYKEPITTSSKIKVSRKKKAKSSKLDTSSADHSLLRNETRFHEDDDNLQKGNIYLDQPLSDKPKDTSHSSATSTSGFPSFSMLSTSSSAMETCHRYPLYVDFEEMGWSGWIIFPQGYNAYHCKGKCFFPLSQRLKPSSHATVQSIMHVLGLGGQPVELPCCAPDALYDITLLYFAHDDNAVLQRYKEMVAGSCACR